MSAPKNPQHWHLYILKLEQGKWYIGIATDPEKRFAQHKKGRASTAWTRIYKPIKIQDSKYLGDIELEKARELEGKLMRKYMEHYGDENVRGGDLTDSDDYRRRYGRFITKNDIEVATVVIFLLLVIVFFILDKLLFSPPHNPTLT